MTTTVAKAGTGSLRGLKWSVTHGKTDAVAEVRCPAPCSKLLFVASDPFVGSVSAKCNRCKAFVRYPADSQPTDVRIECSCKKWLAMGVVAEGWIQVVCRRHGDVVRIEPPGIVTAPRAQAGASFHVERVATAP